VERFAELSPEVTLLGDVNLTIAVLFSRAALASDAGDDKVCGDLLTAIPEQQQSGNLTKWQHAGALGQRAEARMRCGDLANAEADATAAAAAWDAIGHDQQAAVARLGLAEIRRRQGRVEDAAILRGAYLASGPPAIRAEYQTAEAHASRDIGNWRSAIESYRKAAAALRSLNDLPGLALVSTDLAIAVASRGDWQLAAESAAEAKEQWQRLSRINQYAPGRDAAADDDNARGLGYLCASEVAVGGSRYARKTLHLACDAFRSAIPKRIRNASSSSSRRCVSRP
jgi:tetratricopeptide (TPR) repeat protein